MTTTLDGLEINTSDITTDKANNNSDTTPLLSIIWLHGLGADGNDFAPVVPELEKLGVKRCRFVFPHAPLQAVTINGGMTMRSWYDITSLDFEAREQDTVGINKSADRVKSLIQREIDRGLPADRIVLAGFSQGGAVILHTAIRLQEKIAGILALSTYLPLTETIAAEKTDTNQHTPIFMAHGQHDDVIDQRYAEASRDTLMQHGYNVQWHSYNMSHSLAMEEIIDVAKWIISIQPR